MSKIALKFRKAYGLYNAGEVAGFEDITAVQLTSGPDQIAEMYDAEAEAALAAAAASDAEALDARAAELDAREAALAAREAATVAVPAADAPPAQGRSAK